MLRRLYLRRTIGIIVGLVSAIAMVDAGWHLAGRWFPIPPPLYGSFGVIDEAPSILRMPFAGILIIALAWFLAGLVGAFAALRIAQWRPAGWIVAVPIVMMILWTGWFVFSPVWLTIVSIVAPPVGCWIAERHFRRARPGDPLIG